MKARIITIGDEILIGQIVDTNSAWLAAELHLLGIPVERMISIADTREAIHQALNEVPSEVGVVIMTGGLGPTKDDITKTALGDWFESGWRSDEVVLAKVHQHFAVRGIAMPEVNVEQALVPDNCTVLFNDHGSAPGMWFEKHNKVYMSLPGVPFEMKAIFTNEVAPRLQLKFVHQAIYHRTVMTQGIGESSLMEIIQDWENDLRHDGFGLAYLPSVGAVRLRISGQGGDMNHLKGTINAYVDRLLPMISDFTYGFDDAALEVVLGELLLANGFSLSTAESCTGGYIAHLITAVPGCSAYFKGSVVAYANDAKETSLDVPSGFIAEHGAVSEAVAMAMAEGARKRFHTDFAVATTGIAGPDGGSPAKPVGTVWIGVAGPKRSFAIKYQMGDHRERNIRKSALQALQLIRKEILVEKEISLLDAMKL